VELIYFSSSKTNIQIAKLMVNALKKYPNTSDLPMTSIDEFV